MLGRFRQGGADLAAIEPHVSQLAVVKNAQGGESGLMFALSDKGRDPLVDKYEKSSANAADNLPDVRRIGITLIIPILKLNDRCRPTPGARLT